MSVFLDSISKTEFLTIEELSYKKKETGMFLVLTFKDNREEYLIQRERDLGVFYSKIINDKKGLFKNGDQIKIVNEIASRGEGLTQIFNKDNDLKALCAYGEKGLDLLIEKFNKKIFGDNLSTIKSLIQYNNDSVIESVFSNFRRNNVDTPDTYLLAMKTDDIHSLGGCVKWGINNERYGFVLRKDSNVEVISESFSLYSSNLSEYSNKIKEIDTEYGSFFGVRNTTETPYVYVKADVSESYYYFATANKKELLEKYVKENESQFKDFILSMKYMQHIEDSRKQSEKVKKEAIKSALAAIITRNMSHNLGSHVLHYSQRGLIDKADFLFNSLLDKELLLNSYIQERDLYEEGEEEKTIRRIKMEFGIPEDIGAALINSLTISLHSNHRYDRYLRGASHILSFIKDRMAFLAAVAEGASMPTIPVSLNHEVFDKLLLDERVMNNKFWFKKETVNYYLQNLVRSEGYSRSDSGQKLDNGGLHITCIDDKNDISLAIPGGPLSAHAIFNIIENFIRNSAKYRVPKSRKQENLCIRIKTVRSSNIVTFFVYDNKGDACMRISQEESSPTLVNHMNKKIDNIKFLNDDGTIDKDDKGLKEMLLSFLWLNYWDLDGGLGDFLYRLNGKLALSDRDHHILNKFRYIMVTEEGDVIGRDIGRYNKINLGITFSVPVHNIVGSPEDLSCDVIQIDSDKLSLARTSYPRFCFESEKLNAYESAVNRNLGSLDKYGLKIGDVLIGENVKIVYEDHYNIRPIQMSSIRSILDNYYYYDSISGGNYTKVLSTQLAENRTKELELRIKESALTRVTIIDERIFNGIKKWIDKDSDDVEETIAGSQLEQTLRNIRVLSWKSEVKFNKSMKSLDGKLSFLVGNEFRSFKNCDIPLWKEGKENDTDFLSIHFGLMEKLKRYNIIETYESFINDLRDSLKPRFICIHSGRGSLANTQEENCFSSMPIIPFSALETLFYDSKYLLTQMFYSLRY